MPSFAQVLLRPRKASRQSRPGSLRVPPLTLRLVTWQRTSFSDPLVCSGISGRSSTMSNSRLLAWSRASRRLRVTKPVLRVKMRSNRGPQGGPARLGRMLAIGFEIAIEPPDQCTGSALGQALLIGKGVELVNQALGMNPAQGMLTDIELTGVITDDHGVG